MQRFLCKLCVLLLLVIVAAPNAVRAKTQSDKIKPTWLRSTPQPLNNTYSFKVIMVDNGQELASSRMLARAELSRYIAKEFNIEISEEVTETSTTTQNGNQYGYTDKETYVFHAKSEEKPVSVYGERVDEYYEIYEEGGIRVFKLYTLYAVSNVGKRAVFDEFNLTTKYGFSARALVPGWAQMYKGSTAKGIAILAAEVAAIGGIVFTENERASYESKMRSQPNFAKQYKTKMDNYETARNCCIGAAAAIWVYNLIDAIVAPGARRVVVKPRNFKVIPMASKDFNGVTLSYNF